MIRRCDYLVNGEPDVYSTFTVRESEGTSEEQWDRHLAFEKQYREVRLVETHKLMGSDAIGLANKVYKVEKNLLFDEEFIL